MDTTEPTLPGIPRGRHARELAVLREGDPTGADEGVDRHPLADRFLCPSWEHPGTCICGASLPPMTEWKNPGAVWTSITCPTCRRCYVDEDTFIAIYDDGCEEGEGGDGPDPVPAPREPTLLTEPNEQAGFGA